MNEIETFKKIIMLISKRCNYELDAFELSLIKAELEPLGWELVNASLSDFYKSMSSGSKFPSLVEIRAKCERLNGIPDGVSNHPRELAEKLWSATARYGDYDADKAKEKLGPIAWKLVENYGSWKNFKEGLMVEDRAIHLSQWTKSLEQISEGVRLHKALQSGASVSHQLGPRPSPQLGRSSPVRDTVSDALITLDTSRRGSSFEGH